MHLTHEEFKRKQLFQAQTMFFQSSIHVASYPLVACTVVLAKSNASPADRPLVAACLPLIRVSVE